MLCPVIMLAGCDSNEAPEETSAPTAEIKTDAQPVANVETSSAVSVPSPILPESKTWSLAQALEHIADETTRLSAAVQLVRLSEQRPVCVPDPLPDRLARRLRVAQLSDERWTLGISAATERELAAPVFIESDGEITIPAEGLEEELALLCLAKNPSLYPHLLFLPDRVLIIDDQQTNALYAQSPPGLHFELVFENDYPYVKLFWRPEIKDQNDQPGELVELARYSWDPYELAFSGPLADKLPDPPGGLFQLDLELSAALIPVGGVLPDPQPFENPTPESEKFEPTPY